VSFPARILPLLLFPFQGYPARSSIARLERPPLFYLLPRGRARWSPTARVQRGSSQTARCTSTGDISSALFPLFHQEGFRVFSRGGGNGEENQALFPTLWHDRGDAVVGLFKLGWVTRPEGDAS
jgi:hypothetical protein